MSRSVSLSAALLFLVTLVFSHSLSAKTGGASVQPEIQSAALLTTATSAFPPQALNIWGSSNYILDDDGYMHKDKDKDWDSDGYKHKTIRMGTATATKTITITITTAMNLPRNLPPCFPLGRQS